MIDELCRITVVGGRRRVDLAVPVHAPICDYADSLAALCALEDNDLMPAAWSLGPLPAKPYPPGRSLTDLGAVDGQVFYLCDALAGEADEPVVQDIAEHVEQARAGRLDRRWDESGRSPATLAGSLLWLAATALALGLRRPADQADAVLAAAFAAVVGLGSALFARIAEARAWPVRRWIRHSASMCAIPCLAVAARAVVLARLAAGHRIPSLAAHTQGLTSHESSVLAAAAGALAGALVAATASVGIATCAAFCFTAAAALVAAALAVFGASGAQSAVVAAVAAYFLLASGPATTVRIARYAFRHDRQRHGTGLDENEAVRAAVGRAMQLLAVWTAAGSAVAGTALVVCALTGSTTIHAAAACLGLALLLRSGGASLAVEVLAVGAAGGAGVAGFLLGPGLTSHTWAAVSASVVLGAVGLWQGAKPAATRNAGRTRTRPAWFASAATVLGALGLALAVASFGVFAHIVHLGHGL